MAKEKKAQIIDKVEESLRKSTVGVVTDYRGITAHEMGALRRKLKGLGIEYRVVKNTLSRKAAGKLGRDGLTGVFTGPVAIAFGFGDESQVPKVLDEYIRTTRSTLKINGGFLGGTPLTARDVSALALLPSRDTLIAQVMAGINAPVSGLMSVINGPMRGVVIALQGRVKQLEGK